MAHVNKTPRKNLHSKSSAKPFANRIQDERYWTTWWRKLRKAWLSHNPVCVKCDQAANVVDHIQPVTQGGDFTNPDNLQSLCTSCHNRKSAKERNGTTT